MKDSTKGKRLPDELGEIQARLDATVLDRVPHFCDAELAKMLIDGFTATGYPVHPDDASLWKRGCIRLKGEDSNHAKD